MYRGVFRKNGNAALTLDVVGVHHALFHNLIFAEGTRLFEHLIDQGGLAMVNMGNDRNVS